MLRATSCPEWSTHLKCRAADDLLLTAENHPAYEQSRRDLAGKTTADLIGIATSSAPLPIRALALWYGVGTDRRPSPRLRPRRGDPMAMFDALRETGISPTTVEIAREGFRKVGEVLCPFVSLLSPLRQQETATLADDEFPPALPQSFRNRKGDPQ